MILIVSSRDLETQSERLSLTARGLPAGGDTMTNVAESSPPTQAAPELSGFQHLGLSVREVATARLGTRGPSPRAPRYEREVPSA